MARTNGKSEVHAPELDAEHELPASDDANDQSSATGVPRSEATSHVSESQKLKVERDALVDRLARLQAEFENARKRGEREQQEFREYALADAVKALLPSLDSFERALSTEADTTEFRNGVELIYKQLYDALLKMGLRPIPAEGEPFDPRFHQAVEMVNTTEAKDHQVLEELQRGYKFKDRLLRPAMVKVAQNPKH
jgi:molecular chaperone GrpE